jgi:CheY-like chemotaxis protein
MVVGLKPKNILLVEDEPTLQRILGSVLGDAGHHVEAVGTAEQAIERLEDGDVDLVLTDKNLPHQSGLDLLREIRRQEAMGRKPLGVVMVTGYPSRDSALQALADDVDGYLIKPFRSLTHAVEAVQRVLDTDLLKRRPGPPLARRLAAVLSGRPGDVAGIPVFVRDLAEAGIVLTAAGAVLVDDLAAARAIVSASLDDLVTASANTSGMACVFVDAGATLQDITTLVSCGGGAIVDGDLIAGGVR